MTTSLKEKARHSTSWLRKSFWNLASAFISWATWKKSIKPHKLSAQKCEQNPRSTAYEQRKKNHNLKDFLIKSYSLLVEIWHNMYT